MNKRDTASLITLIPTLSYGYLISPLNIAKQQTTADVLNQGLTSTTASPKESNAFCDLFHPFESSRLVPAIAATTEAFNKPVV